MNSIKAVAGSTVPVAVLTPNLVFACSHVTWPFSDVISLSKDDQPYPTETKYLRFTKADGTLVEERQDNFNVKDKIYVIQGGDGVFYQTWRNMPVEAIEKVKVVKVGEKVVVESRRTKTDVEATVTKVGVADGTISTDYKAHSGDSGSKVKDVDGNFVGFVSAQIIPSGGVTVEGSVVVVPETGILGITFETAIHPSENDVQDGSKEPTLPQPVPAPVPVEPGILVVSNFDTGFIAGKKALALELKGKLDELTRLVNTFLS
jgi:hypothetical protein